MCASAGQHQSWHAHIAQWRLTSVMACTHQKCTYGKWRLRMSGDIVQGIYASNEIVDIDLVIKFVASHISKWRTTLVMACTYECIICAYAKQHLKMSGNKRQDLHAWVVACVYRLGDTNRGINFVNARHHRSWTACIGHVRRAYDAY